MGNVINQDETNTGKNENRKVAMYGKQVESKVECNAENKGTIRLSISVLASNRFTTMRKCFDSIQPFFDAFPTELIVVDTGCSEEARKIIKEYTNHIVPFTWINDFSAARNAGLREATGEWFLYLDDDEWFEDVSEIIDFIKRAESKTECHTEENEFDALYYIQRNYRDAEGKTYTDVPAARMARRTEELHFQYAVHEVMLPAPAHPFQSTAYVHHFGYVYGSEEERQAHIRRNLGMLQKECEKYPEDERMHLQLAEEYLIAGDMDEALTITKELLMRMKESEEERATRYFSWLCDMHIKALFTMQQYKELLDLSWELMNLSGVTELCKLSLAYHSALVCMNIGQAGLGQSYVTLYFKLADLLTQNRELVENQKIQNLEEYLGIEIQNIATKCMCIFAWHNKDLQSVGEMLERIDWSTDVYGLNRACGEIRSEIL